MTENKKQNLYVFHKIERSDLNNGEKNDSISRAIIGPQTHDGEDMIMIFPAFPYRVHSCFEFGFGGKREPLTCSGMALASGATVVCEGTKAP